MRVVCNEQGTAEWLSARVGKIGASNISKAMAFLKRASGTKKVGDSSAERDNFILELATELITRVPVPHYVSPAMDIGTQYEGEARIEYWMDTGNEVEQTGFVLHPTIDFLGASPDGIMLPIQRGLEIKVPLPHTHMRYLKEDVIPEEYVPQMQLGMLCCELPEWDFMSYCPPDICPELPDRFRRFIKTLKADPDMHRAMEDAALKAMTEAAELVVQISEKYPERVQRERREPPAETFDDNDLTGPDFAWFDSINMTP
jgi:putative phage-type endonuclease